MANTMGTILRLEIGVRIPITVVQDDNIGRGQVDTETSSTRREQENKLLAAGSVILVDSDDTVLVSRSTVDTAVFWPEITG